jgi:prepilin-type N-terminal cleavage/methylation domain-containing protein
MTRRGFTLIELLVTLVVLAILGTALARLMMSNSRFVARQEAQLEARQTARAAMNVVTTELRMVSDGGLLAASADSVRVLVPYAFGVLCRNGYALLAPPDSAAYAAAVPGGIAYQQASGGYTFNGAVAVTGTTASTTECDKDSLRLVPGGKRITLSSTTLPTTAIFYLYQRVTYKFAASVALPGRRALWRNTSAGNEELLAPFADSARFAFLVGSRLTVQTTVPAFLSQIRGLELRLTGESEGIPEGASAPIRFPLAPRVKFMNQLPL